MKLNLVCTSKPCDGLFYYSYEYTQYLNLCGIKTDMIVITHPRFSSKIILILLIKNIFHLKT